MFLTENQKEVTDVFSRTFLMELKDVLPERFRRPRGYRLDRFLEWLFRREYGFNVVKFEAGDDLKETQLSQLIQQYHGCAYEQNQFLSELRARYGRFELMVVEKSGLVLLIFDLEE